jgi:hypothetical protein
MVEEMFSISPGCSVFKLNNVILSIYSPDAQRVLIKIYVLSNVISHDCVFYSDDRVICSSIATLTSKLYNHKSCQIISHKVALHQTCTKLFPNAAPWKSRKELQQLCSFELLILLMFCTGETALRQQKQGRDILCRTNALQL